MIDSYRSGEIIIDGKVYTSDVIILHHQVKDDWWRGEGHKLCADDLKVVIMEKPEVLVVGTGDSGMMRVPPETIQYLASLGIELISETTEKTCQTYNKLLGSKKVVAAIHLTC